MFESGQLESEEYATQRSFVTYVTIIVVVSSIIYFLAVFFSEVYQTVRPAQATQGADDGMSKAEQRRQRQRQLREAEAEVAATGGIGTVGDTKVVMEINPMVASAARDEEKAQRTATALTAELRRLKRQQQMSVYESGGGGNGAPTGRGARRASMARPRRSSMSRRSTDNGDDGL